VGVHTPEFAFEHELANVRTATHDLGVTWPVALDNGYATWNAYSNEYWPAEYFLDKRGHVRRAHFGEGEYALNEQVIRTLLNAPATTHARAVADATPTGLGTPETYLGYGRLNAAQYFGTDIRQDRLQRYRAPAHLAQNALDYAGMWNVGRASAVAGPGAALHFHVHARNVYLVLGGKGTVQVRFPGVAPHVVRVDGDRLYTLVTGGRLRDGLLELGFTPGLSAYAFTFG
jgi:hypothetical protein